MTYNLSNGWRVHTHRMEKGEIFFCQLEMETTNGNDEDFCFFALQIGVSVRSNLKKLVWSFTKLLRNRKLFGSIYYHMFHGQTIGIPIIYKDSHYGMDDNNPYEIHWNTMFWHVSTMANILMIMDVENVVRLHIVIFHVVWPIPCP